jgi:IclR family acetate operon transcriptional repressor
MEWSRACSDKSNGSFYFSRFRYHADVTSSESAAEPTGESALPGETPAVRLISLLELIASKDAFVTLQGLTEETGLPKPTLHRMLQQLEGADLLIRQADGRHYGTGARLRQLAENLLLNATQHGARHAVLRALVDELGESCNVTALSGNEIVYLDRMETTAPLRIYLHPGSRVPVHASASGKMIMSQMTSAQRRKLLAHAPLQRHTPRTITDLEELEAQLVQVQQDGYAVDDEEFLKGLVCVAVLVPSPSGRSNLCIAVQGPAVRISPHQAPELLPSLERAAKAIADIESEGAIEE